MFAVNKKERKKVFTREMTLLALFDFHHIGRLCTFSSIPTAVSAGIARRLQPSS
jgi:hypothetical protein